MTPRLFDVQWKTRLALAWLCGLGFAAFVPRLAGQDPRPLRQPHFPPTAIRLRARLRLNRQGGLSAAEEARLDTARIQAALNRCPWGHAVELAARGARAAFVSGPLELRSGVTLRIGAGARLLLARNPRLFAITPGSCGVINRNGRGCKPLLSGDHIRGAALMGPGMIDGRGGERIMGSRSTWWQIARQAQKLNLNQNCPRLLVLNHCRHFTLYEVTLRDSPNFHVLFTDGRGFTAWGVHIYAPALARNTDGIDLISSRRASIVHCWIHTGDDDICLKSNGSGPLAQVTIAHDHCLTGHGVSIGSETWGGVHAVRVRDVTLDGAVNGLRIKSNRSRGGVVENVRYRNICIRNSRYPLLLDTHYPYHGRATHRIPWYHGISLHNVRIEGPGTVELIGYDARHRLGLRLRNVTVDSLRRIRIVARHARLRVESGPFNLRITGPDVRVWGRPRAGRGLACRQRWKIPPPGLIPRHPETAE